LLAITQSALGFANAALAVLPSPTRWSSATPPLPSRPWPRAPG
jgi:hypothetical protein